MRDGELDRRRSAHHEDGCRERVGPHAALVKDGDRRDSILDRAARQRINRVRMTRAAVLDEAAIVTRCRD